jgi:hypothetical protein
MKRLLWLLPLLLSPLCRGQASPVACTTASATSFNCAYGSSIPVGSVKVAAIFAAQATDTDNTHIPIVSDNVDGTWTQVAPCEVHGTPPGGIVIFYHPDASAGSTTVTVTSNGGGAQAYDVMLFNFTGVALVSPITNCSQSIYTSSSAAPTGSLTLLAGTYQLLSFVGDSVANTYTPSSGWSSVLTLSGNYLSQAWTQTVTPSTSTSYQNSITMTGGSVPYSFIIPFAATNQMGAGLRQVSNGGGGAGAAASTKQFTLPTVAGNIELVTAAFDGATTGISVTSTHDSTHWTQICVVPGTGTSYNAAYYLPGTYNTGGNETIVFNPTANTAMKIQELSGATGLDVYSCTGANGTSVSSTSGTTNYPNEYAFGFLGSSGSCGSVGFNNTVGSPWSLIGAAGAHCAQTLNFNQIIRNNIGTTISLSGTTPSTSQITAGVFGFASLVQPANGPSYLDGNSRLNGKARVF